MVELSLWSPLLRCPEIRWLECLEREGCSGGWAVCGVLGRLDAGSASFFGFVDTDEEQSELTGGLGTSRAFSRNHWLYAKKQCGHTV